MNNNENKLCKDERMIEYFLGEIKRQCEYVFISDHLLKNSLRNGDANNVFYSIQNIFTALGNISKMLFPTQKYRIRGKALREKLEIKEGTQFFYDANSEVARKYRNILEHYDEYFEDWYSRENSNFIIDTCVGPKNMIQIGNNPARYLRRYNPQDNKFIFLEDEYNLTPVIEETQKIYEKIKNIEGEKFGYRKR